MKWNFVVLGLLCLLMSCAGTPPPIAVAPGSLMSDMYVFYRDGNPSEFSSKIVFSRARSALGIAGTFELFVDGKQVASVAYPDKVEIEVPSGTHTITLKSLGLLSSQRLVHFLRGSVLYLDVGLHSSDLDPMITDAFIWRDTPIVDAPPEATTTTKTTKK